MSSSSFVDVIKGVVCGVLRLCAPSLFGYRSSNRGVRRESHAYMSKNIANRGGW